MQKLTDDQLKCKSTCKECHGTGMIGGDIESIWCCTRWSIRIRRYNRLDPYLPCQVDGTDREPIEAAYRAEVEKHYAEAD